MKKGFSIPDIINGARLLNLVFTREDFYRIFNSNGIGAEEMGIEMFISILEKASNEQIGFALADFVTGALEMEFEEYHKADVLDIFDKLKEKADKERWKRFFTSVFKTSLKSSSIASATDTEESEKQVISSQIA